MYKILAKVLASRLTKVIGKIVGPTGILDRQILDASLILNECFNSYLKSNRLGVLCKLDIEKAFDYNSWDFLMVIFQIMGFPCK